MKGENEGKQTLVFARNHKSSCVCLALELTTWVGIVSFSSTHNTGRILCVILGSVETQFPVLPKASEFRSHCTVIPIQFFRLFLVFLSSPHAGRQKGSRFPWTNSMASVGVVLFCFGNRGLEASSPCQPVMFSRALTFVVQKVNTQAESGGNFFEKQR